VRCLTGEHGFDSTSHDPEEGFVAYGMPHPVKFSTTLVTHECTMFVNISDIERNVLEPIESPQKLKHGY
jgi:hypothetical protein